MTKRRVILPIISIALLVVSTLLLKGCGEETIFGDKSGVCPDSTAPAGYTITGPADLGAPSAASGACYPGLPFTVLDDKGFPANGICVEVFSNAYIALHTATDCNDVIANPASTIVTRTDSAGHISISMVAPASTVGTVFFVQAQSGAASKLVEAAASE